MIALPNIRYRNYKLEDAQGVSLLDVADFSQPIDVRQEHVRYVLTDLHGFTTQGLSGDTKSTLGLSVDDKELTVKKDFSNQQVDIQPPMPGVDEWTNGFILVPPSLGANLDTQLKHLVSTAKAIEPPPSAQTKQKLLALGDENITNIVEIVEKIDQVESELGRQKRKDEITLSLGEIEAELDSTQEKISSVGDLIEKKAGIDTALAKFGELVQHDLESESIKLRGQLEQVRGQELQQAVTSSRVVPPLGGGSDSPTGRQGVYGLSLLILAIITVVLAIAGYLASASTSVILVGVLATFVELTLFALINLLPLQVSIPSKVTHHTAEAPTTNARQGGGLKGALQQIEGFFIKKAWINALLSESGQVGEVVKKCLNGQSIDELKTAQQLLQQNVANLRLEVERLADAEIPPQQYLEKRRELDMLKLDKTRLDRDLRSRDDYDAIAADLQLLASAEQVGQGGAGSAWRRGLCNGDK